MVSNGLVDLVPLSPLLPLEFGEVPLPPLALMLRLLPAPATPPLLNLLPSSKGLEPPTLPSAATSPASLPSSSSWPSLV